MREVVGDVVPVAKGKANRARYWDDIGGNCSNVGRADTDATKGSWEV